MSAAQLILVSLIPPPFRTMDYLPGEVEFYEAATNVSVRRAGLCRFDRQTDSIKPIA